MGDEVSESSGGTAPDRQFWNGRRVLVTGHTGFKGSWLTCWLRELGAEVLGVALPDPPTHPSLWNQIRLQDVKEVRVDMRTDGWVRPVLEFSPEIVMHLAAQPLVSVGYASPLVTFETNILATLKVMDLIARLPDLVAALIVTTDKVYDPRQTGPHGEEHYLGGRDPYSASKAAAELLVHSWPSNPRVATARAGNVIGGGDWAGNRLLPDLLRAWNAGVPVELRQPEAVRPWQHVLEPLRGYLLYLERLATEDKVARALNFGPSGAQRVSVGEVAKFAASYWGADGKDVPRPAWVNASSEEFAETFELSLSSDLAREQLGWEGVLDWKEAVALTIEWYCGLGAGQLADDLISGQLAGYLARLQGTTE